MSKMDIKKDLIRNLENEITGGDNNMKYFGCTADEAIEVLKRVKSGYYNQLTEALTIRIDLHKFLKYALEIQKTNPSEPSLKEYKIYCIKYDLAKALEFLSFDNSNETRETYQEKIGRLLTTISKGVYDELLLGEEFWFAAPVKAEPLLEWNELRENCCQKNKATLPNYIVFNIYYLIMDHIRRVNTWKDTFGNNYECRYTGHEQTPTTEEELQYYENLGKLIVSQEYDWREARNVVREFNKLDIFNDYKFPHNIEKTFNCFEHDKNILFPNYEGKGKCSHDLEAISERARDLLEVLNEDNLENIYLNKNEDKVAEYLRKMITSQFDFASISKESYSGIDKQKIKSILEKPNLYSDYEINNCFSHFPIKTRKTLCDLAKGVLYSLSAYQEGSHIDIFDDAINLQKALNCWHGTISYNNYNSVRLSNGDTIFSIPYEDIESIYSSYQKEYEYYFKNSTTDLEYIEGCAEVVGNVMTSQIFMTGNKRTSKCLFNAMLTARGIVPPILDFCDKDLNLWEKFALNRDNKYRHAKQTILEKSLEAAKYFDADKYITTNKEYIKN